MDSSSLFGSILIIFCLCITFSSMVLSLYFISFRQDLGICFDVCLTIFLFAHSPRETLLFDECLVDSLDLDIGKHDLDTFPNLLSAGFGFYFR